LTVLSDASLDRLPLVWGRRSSWRPVAVVAVAVIAIDLETATPRLDHGTHLLVALAAVLAVVLLLGPKPATVSLVLGAAVAGIASAMGEQGTIHVTGAYVQLAAYLFAGGISILLVVFATMPRSRGPADTPMLPRIVIGPPPSASPLPELLTARELEILRLAATGVSVDEMARHLCLSPNTVKTHLTHIYAKLAVRGRTDAVRAALHAGWLTPEDICPHRLP
jgi:DNA-binding NarL/FixJ family response regulator